MIDRIQRDSLTFTALAVLVALVLMALVGCKSPEPVIGIHHPIGFSHGLASVENGWILINKDHPPMPPRLFPHGTIVEQSGLAVIAPPQPRETNVFPMRYPKNFAPSHVRVSHDGHSWSNIDHVVLSNGDWEVIRDSPNALYRIVGIEPTLPTP